MVLLLPFLVELELEIKHWFLRKRESQGTQRKTSCSKGENQQQTQPTHIHVWCRCQELNSRYISGRWMLSPLRHPLLPSKYQQLWDISFWSLTLYCTSHISPCLKWSLIGGKVIMKALPSIIDGNAFINNYYWCHGQGLQSFEPVKFHDFSIMTFPRFPWPQD